MCRVTYLEAEHASEKREADGHASQTVQHQGTTPQYLYQEHLTDVYY